MESTFDGKRTEFTSIEIHHGSHSIITSPIPGVCVRANVVLHIASNQQTDHLIEIICVFPLTFLFSISRKK